MKKSMNYNKLIRDKIPEIIRNDNWIPKTRVLKKQEFLKELKKKVLEEAQELTKAKNKKEIINEIIDIQELINFITKELKLTKNQIKYLQKFKNKKRGSFKKRLFLIKSIKNK